MRNTLPLEERSITQLYIDNREPIKYVIPIYQRNYAWEEDQISALIKDVHDSMQKDAQSTYYIGTLVTYKRGDNEYEVIDGQQRLTTIYILLKALGIEEFGNKLTYSARRASASTIERLEKYPNLGDEVDYGIRDGYKAAVKVLNTLFGKSEKTNFTNYFLKNVHIIHYQVPKDVDLNHYFEVMNSRGEQLEKHEIVKSRLIQYLTTPDRSTFSRIWEACSEMNKYIQQVFSDTGIFGKSLNTFTINNFEQIPAQNDMQGKDSIMNLLKSPIVKINDEFKDQQIDKFQPIIDFSNFLLIILKLTRLEYEQFDPRDFVLDDKELVNEFEKALRATDNCADFIRKFIFNLLKGKFLLDNYIIHHALGDTEKAGDNPWRLQIYLQESNNKYYPKNLSIAPDIQVELVHLLSMFEVSFTPKQRKNYLLYCLMYLFKNFNHGDMGYLNFLRALAHKYFYQVYLNPDCLNERSQPLPNAFDNIVFKDGDLNLDNPNPIGDYVEKFEKAYPIGSMDIPLFVFNYTDYLIWRKYAEELRGEKEKQGSPVRKKFFEELGCCDFDLTPFNHFYFSRTRKSLEHYYPQAKAGDDKYISYEDINCFGNFAMIGADANSSGSNWDPRQKLEHYNDGKANQVSVASLKFKIMMQKCRDNYRDMLNGDLNRQEGMEWNVDDMKNHQQKMLDIILKRSEKI